MQHDTSPSHFFAFNEHSVYLSNPWLPVTRWPLKPLLESGEIKSDTVFPSRNTFNKIIRNQQNQQQLVRNLNILQQSARRAEPTVRPVTISHVWIIICGLFHNMGGIGCCLLRNVYVAPQSSGETLIWWETELINWFVLVKAAKRAYQHAGHGGKTFLCYKWHITHPASSVRCVILTMSHISALKNMRDSEIVRHDIISEMCASTVIFGWRLNCKRQTWISLCLSLSSWQEQSQNFGWSSSWPRCSVQISATRWRWRPLHTLDGHCKAPEGPTVQ